MDNNTEGPAHKRDVWSLLAGTRAVHSDDRVACLREVRARGREGLEAEVPGCIEEVLDTVMDGFYDTVFSVRREAAETAGELSERGDAFVIEELMLLTEDENDYVRCAKNMRKGSIMFCSFLFIEHCASRATSS